MRQQKVMSAEWIAICTIVSCSFDLPRLADIDGSLPLQYPSCMELALTCGVSGAGSCCEPAKMIAGGTFFRGNDAAADAYNDTSYPATVSPFLLDRYEVTVGRFRKFVEAGLGTQANPPMTGSGAHPRLAGSGWDGTWNAGLAADTAALKAGVKCNSAYETWTDTPGINENKPISCATWYEAMAFCIWDGGYLPTEAEWQYAASGGDEQRAYPWSTPAGSLGIDCFYANYYVDNPSGTYCVNGTMGGLNRVGSESLQGDGRWGHADLAGNAWEWVLDWYVEPYPSPQTCNDCANLASAANRVIRGGGFGYDASGLRVAYRNSATPVGRDFSTGFRCARTP